MPFIVNNPLGQVRSELAQDIGYKYPNGEDLRPGSKLHEKIKTEVIRRATESRLKMTNRFSSWNEIDKIMTVYVTPEEAEEKIKEKNPRKPVSIVFPYSFVVMESLITYLCVAFFQNPLFRYEGVGPEDTVGAMLLEKVIDVHCNKNKVILALHTMFRDSVAYGLGISSPVWTVKRGFKTRVSNPFIMNEFGEMVPGPREKVTTEETIFEGNGLENIDPYMFLPDPNVSIHKVQDGEFCGWVDRCNLMDLLSEERWNEDVFNVKYLKDRVFKKSSIFGEDKSGREERFGSSKLGLTSDTTNPVDVINLYVKLIPKDWGLGESEYPEKWFFAVASDDIVITAKPLGMNHNLFPIAIGAPDFDGYSSTPISRMEVMSGLQTVLDWMFNSHVANVRKSINDMFIVDPYMVNMNDLRDPQPGKLIRLSNPAWGKGVKDAIMQLSVNDVTRGNIADSSYIVSWMQKIGAADDFMMGALRTGGPERLTGGEFKGTKQGAVSRLERIARIIGVQSMQDIGDMFASHTQQLMSKELFIKSTGRYSADLMKMIGTEGKSVSPFDIIVDYDVLTRDGSIPGGNFSEAWIQLLGYIFQQPELNQMFDVPRIFEYVATNMGAKNTMDFIRPKVEGDQQVMNQVQAGNLVPAQEIGNV